jgi:hypothetical protein
MKRTTALGAVTALAALSFSSQAFARGGSMGGGQVPAASGATTRMGPTMQTGAGTSMQQGSVPGSGMPTGSAAGTASQGMKQAGVGSGADSQSGQVKGKGK